MPRLSARASSHQRLWPCLVQVIDSQAYWTKSMTNSFCYCLLPLGSSSGPGPKHQGYVVDPAIKDYFQAAPATPRYQAVWGALPEVFAQGRQLPPWRSFTATQGRWLEPPDPPPAAAEAVILRGPALVSAGLTVSASSAASQALMVLRGFSPPLHEDETAMVLPGSSVQSGLRSSDSRVRLRQAGPGLAPPVPWPAVPAQGPGGSSVAGPGGVQGSALSCTVPGSAAGAQAQAAGLGLEGPLQALLGGSGCSPAAWATARLSGSSLAVTLLLAAAVVLHSCPAPACCPCTGQTL
ncbi:predicted protein [Haematococcus lacustris]|uniref:Uncharacterized protein n=1 Tax=Haematococcus lacustris TaxID=44745 RepID=A0A6A0A9R7_HAELA|nr:predicted protein [Haematococcus lacustris]